MRRMIICLAGAALAASLLRPAAGSAQEVQAVGAPEVGASAAIAPAGVSAAGARGGGGFFVEPGLGILVPLSDDVYDEFIDASFDVGVSVGYLFRLGGGASVGPEIQIGYTAHDVNDDRERHWYGVQVDAYAGRFRAIAAGRFLLDFGKPYLFCRLGLGLDMAHASWEYTVPGMHVEDDESDAGLGWLVGFGFGVRLGDMVGVAAMFQFPMSAHDDDDPPDGGAPYDVQTVDIELLFGATLFL